MPTALKQHRIESAAVQIPDRLYFKISDVASLCGVAASVLRFWQTQFPQLKPNKSGTGQRLYRRRDVEVALEIKRLVHDEGYTLAGARQVMSIKPAQRVAAAAVSAPPTERRVEVEKASGLIEANATGISGTDARGPEMTQPETCIPGMSSAETSFAETSFAEISLPEISLSQTSYAGTNLPAAEKLEEYIVRQQDSVTAIVGNARTELRTLLGILQNPPRQLPAQQQQPVLQMPERQLKRPKGRVQVNDFALLFPVE